MYSSHLGEGLGWNINQFKLISSRDYWKVSENGSNVFSIICKLRVCQITFSQEPSVDFQGKCFFIETYEFWILLMSCSSFGLCFPWKHPRIVCLNNNSSAFNKMTFAFTIVYVSSMLETRILECKVNITFCETLAKLNPDLSMTAQVMLEMTLQTSLWWCLQSQQDVNSIFLRKLRKSRENQSEIAFTLDLDPREESSTNPEQMTQSNYHLKWWFRQVYVFGISTRNGEKIAGKTFFYFWKEKSIRKKTQELRTSLVWIKNRI